MTTIEKLLSCKGRQVATTNADTSVADAVDRMNCLRIGSLVVVEGKRVVGILTEKEVMTRLVGPGKDPRCTTVADIMTRNFATVHPLHTLEQATQIISDNRRRHLPVVDGHRLCGMVSAGDLTKWQLEERKMHILDLEGYITRA